MPDDCPNDPLPPSVAGWLARWAELIRRHDFVSARALFSPNVHGFGTVAEVASGLDTLVETQWKRVWGQTRGFRFLEQSAVGWGDERAYCVAVQWESEGLDALSKAPYARRGRATVMLQRATLDSDWQGVHTHFSVVPQPERFLTSPCISGLHPQTSER